MTLNEDDIDNFTRMLSAERLAALVRLTNSHEIAVELHQETLRLGSCLMTAIATVEIALRNSVCENLTRHFAVPNWLLQPPVPFQWRAPELSKITTALSQARRAEYSKLTQAQKHALDPAPTGQQMQRSHLQRARERQKQIQVSEGKVVAELTLYFWKRLYGPEYEQSLWRTSLKRTFPYKKLSRAAVAVELEQIYQTRNRLAHHEPVLHGRFQETLRAIEFVAQHLDTTPPRSNSSLGKLLKDDLQVAKEKAAALHRRLDTFRPAK
jgi:hypothetical protein